jgi:hypothetical protein
VQDALSQRRDLQYELLSERRAAQSVALDAAGFADRHWPRHLVIQRSGYGLLDFCTAVGDRPATPEEITRLAETVKDARQAATS